MNSILLKVVDSTTTLLYQVKQLKGSDHACHENNTKVVAHQNNTKKETNKVFIDHRPLQDSCQTVLPAKN